MCGGHSESNTPIESRGLVYHSEAGVGTVVLQLLSKRHSSMNRHRPCNHRSVADLRSHAMNG
eukprot:5604232-Amphidinium_carterae.2